MWKTVLFTLSLIIVNCNCRNDYFWMDYGTDVEDEVRQELNNDIKDTNDEQSNLDVAENQEKKAERDNDMVTPEINFNLNVNIEGADNSQLKPVVEKISKNDSRSDYTINININIKNTDEVTKEAGKTKYETNNGAKSGCSSQAETTLKSKDYAAQITHDGLKIFDNSYAQTPSRRVPEKTETKSDVPYWIAKVLENVAAESEMNKYLNKRLYPEAAFKRAFSDQKTQVWLLSLITPDEN